MLSDSVHFKLTHNGKTSRFIFSRAHSNLLFAVTERVAAIIGARKDAKVTLEWRDVNSASKSPPSIPIDNLDDLKRAIDHVTHFNAEEESKKPACLYLVAAIATAADKSTEKVSHCAICEERFGDKTEFLRCFTARAHKFCFPCTRKAIKQQIMKKEINCLSGGKCPKDESSIKPWALSVEVIQAVMGEEFEEYAKQREIARGAFAAASATAAAREAAADAAAAAAATVDVAADTADVAIAAIRETTTVAAAAVPDTTGKKTQNLPVLTKDEPFADPLGATTAVYESKRETKAPTVVPTTAERKKLDAASLPLAAVPAATVVKQQFVPVVQTGQKTTNTQPVLTAAAKTELLTPVVKNVQSSAAPATKHELPASVIAPTTKPTVAAASTKTALPTPVVKQQQPAVIAAVVKKPVAAAAVKPALPVKRPTAASRNVPQKAVVLEKSCFFSGWPHGKGLKKVICPVGHVVCYGCMIKSIKKQPIKVHCATGEKCISYNTGRTWQMLDGDIARVLGDEYEEYRQKQDEANATSAGVPVVVRKPAPKMTKQQSAPEDDFDAKEALRSAAATIKSELAAAAGAAGGVLQGAASTLAATAAAAKSGLKEVKEFIQQNCPVASDCEEAEMEECSKCDKLQQKLEKLEKQLKKTEKKIDLQYRLIN